MKKINESLCCMSKINNLLNQLYFDKKKIDQCLKKKSQLPQKYLEKEALARMSSGLEGVSLQVGCGGGGQKKRRLPQHSFINCKLLCQGGFPTWDQ